jgi:hypothetical protein
MTRRRIYHTVTIGLSFFWSGALTSAFALEQKEIADVWPLGQRQQYIYSRDGVQLGEAWLEIKAVPKTSDRYEMINTIDLNVAADKGGDVPLKGTARAEVDAWGHPISYDLELVRRGVKLVHLTVLFNWPNADVTVVQADSVRRENHPFNEESLLLDYHFIGLYDLAFRLNPVNPQATFIRRNYFIPQLEYNVLSDFPVEGEELLTMEDGTEVPTVKVVLAAAGINVWLAPDGRLVRSLSMFDGVEARPGKTLSP